MGRGLFTQLIILVVFILIMYFLLIRPQKKREKEINDMRNSIEIGDEVVTIGGICGKIMKTRGDNLTIQVGADRVRFEIKRWAVSNIEKKKKSGARAASNKAAVEDKGKKEKTTKTAKPKRLVRPEDKEESAEDESSDR